MRRITLLLATTMGLALLLAGVALAATVNCADQAQFGGSCTGTSKADDITGTIYEDDISALGGNDAVDAGGNDDVVFGGSGADTLLDNQATDSGNDSLYGQGGEDILNGGADSNILSGGDGNDSIYAATQFANFGERVDGGRGNDTIYADDGYFDDITCGPGTKDRVTYDQFDSVDSSCEIERLNGAF